MVISGIKFAFYKRKPLFHIFSFPGHFLTFLFFLRPAAD